MVLLAQVVAQITGAALVLDHQLVCTLATLDDAVQERGPRSRHPAGLVAVVLGRVVA
jgi:hypothetical protein